MSGRIRTVKPEWLEDERIGRASDAARVLTVALILMADDHGNGRASPAFVASRAWPYAFEDDPGETLARASRAIRECVAIGFVELYEVAGQRYFAIRNWSKHQRVDKPSKPRVPGPDHGETVDVPALPVKPREPFAKTSGESRETLAPDPDLRPHTTDHYPDRSAEEGADWARVVRAFEDAWREETGQGLGLNGGSNNQRRAMAVAADAKQRHRAEWLDRVRVSARGAACDPSLRETCVKSPFAVWAASWAKWLAPASAATDPIDTLNNRINDAIESGDLDEVARLRQKLAELHASRRRGLAKADDRRRAAS